MQNGRRHAQIFSIFLHGLVGIDDVGGFGFDAFERMNKMHQFIHGGRANHFLRLGQKAHKFHLDGLVGQFLGPQGNHVMTHHELISALNERREQLSM